MRRKSSMAVGLSALACLISTVGCQTEAPARRGAWGNNTFNSGAGAAPANAAGARNNAAATAGMNSPYSPTAPGAPSPVRPASGLGQSSSNAAPASFNAPAMQTPTVATPGANVQYSQPQGGFPQSQPQPYGGVPGGFAPPPPPTAPGGFPGPGQ